MNFGRTVDIDMLGLPARELKRSQKEHGFSMARYSCGSLKKAKVARKSRSSAQTDSHFVWTKHRIKRLIKPELMSISFDLISGLQRNIVKA